MSYRSDVRIITSKKGFKELKKFINQYLDANNFDYANLLNECTIMYENDYEKYFGWNSIKWCDDIDDFENISAIMEGLKHLEGEDYSYRFVRIGESYDDYEEFYYKSTKKEEQGLKYLCMRREFDDEYIFEQMKLDNKKMEM